MLTNTDYDLESCLTKPPAELNLSFTQKIVKKMSHATKIDGCACKRVVACLAFSFIICIVLVGRDVLDPGFFFKRLFCVLSILVLP